jgi:hypothetical protein
MNVSVNHHLLCPVLCRVQSAKERTNVRLLGAKLVAYCRDTEAAQIAYIRRYRRHCTTCSCTLAQYLGVLCVYSAEL